MKFNKMKEYAQKNVGSSESGQESSTSRPENTRPRRPEQYIISSFLLKLSTLARKKAEDAAKERKEKEAQQVLLQDWKQFYDLADDTRPEPSEGLQPSKPSASRNTGFVPSTNRRHFIAESIQKIGPGTLDPIESIPDIRKRLYEDIEEQTTHRARKLSL